jgi:hypothetical protein
MPALARRGWSPGWYPGRGDVPPTSALWWSALVARTRLDLVRVAQPDRSQPLHFEQRQARLFQEPTAAQRWAELLVRCANSTLRGASAYCSDAKPCCGASVPAGNPLQQRRPSVGAGRGKPPAAPPHPGKENLKSAPQQVQPQHCAKRPRCVVCCIPSCRRQRPLRVCAQGA